MSVPLVEICGAAGGGQILRNAFAYAALTGRELKVKNIRGNRSPPGLKMQHLTGIQLCQKVAGGTLIGAEVKSVDVHFRPSGRLIAGNVEGDAVTAGSCTLLVQCVLPLMLFADSNKAATNRLMVKGGTDVSMSPPLDYLLHVFLPVAEMFGLQTKVEGFRRGVFPKGQGRLILHTTPLKEGAALKPVELMSAGDPVRIWGRCFVTPRGDRAARECKVLKNAVLDSLKDLGVPVRIDEEVGDAACHGAGVVLVMEMSTGVRFAGSSVKDRNASYQDMAKAAVGMLKMNASSGVAVEEYLQDQLIILAALAQGTSKFLTGPITEHTECAIKVAEELTPARFDITKLPDGKNIIACEGFGHRA